MSRLLHKLKKIGPGAVVAAAFIGPGTVTTATLSGASYGYTLLWAVTFSVVATCVLQEMSLRLALIGSMDLGSAIRHRSAGKWLKVMAQVLVLGAILVGNAAYEAGNLTGAGLGLAIETDRGSALVYLAIGLIAFLLMYSGRYVWIERFLVTLVALMGVVFFMTALMVADDWLAIVRAALLPRLPDQSGWMVLGLIGTTVVPYNLFLHASSVRRKWSRETDLSAARWDAFISIILGGLITMAIVITAAAVQHSGPGGIQAVGDLGRQLEPLLGSWSTTFIAAGFFAAGLSSSVTAPLAAAFATAGILGWGESMKSRRFRVTWFGVLLIGVLFASLGYRPVQVILFAQVANGLLLPVVAGFLLWIMNDRELLGVAANRGMVNAVGMMIWLVTLALGIRSVMLALAG